MGTGLGKQAKILTPQNITKILDHISRTRYPIRNKVIFLLSCKAGLRAKEISAITWSMVLNSDGVVGDVINLTNIASKGKKGGRQIPFNDMLKEALVDLFNSSEEKPLPESSIIRTERGNHTTAQVITNFFKVLYSSLGLKGLSSHSGRRTFITNCATKISLVGGSLRDVQQLAGHGSLQTTQRYIEGNSEAKQKLVKLI
ncbi:MAG: site-specific integrase [Alphaproteobacteria bacterium]|nr:site-specific integrase [Alphaproteobacteria bacterium]